MNTGKATLLDQDREVDLRAVLSALRKHALLITGVTAASAAVALYIALTSNPVFRAEVTMTEVRDAGIGGARSIATELGGLASLAGVALGAQDSATQEARAVLKSRHLVEEFIRRNGIIQELAPRSGEDVSLWRASKRFKEKIVNIREDARNGVTTVAIEWTDPETAARWANGFVSLANELLRTRALDNAGRNVKYLNEQVAKTNVVELQRVMYNLIESETKTLMLANARLEYAFAVVDPAVPPEIRVRPRRSLIVLAGIGLGLVAGVVASLLRNLLGRR